MKEWRGPQEEGEFPTLGYVVADYIEAMCAVPDGPTQGELIRLSDEQLEFLVWMYRLDPQARPDPLKPSRAFVFDRGGQLVAPQKWGKGPFSAAWICAEAGGPVLFDGWDAQGEPVGRPWPSPWIQVTAVSEDQTDNIWLALIPMIELGNIRADMPDTGLSRINLPNRGKIEPVTSSAKSRLGQRITAAAQDETHSWTRQNGGRKVADNQRRNLAGMGGRFLDTSNAWDPAEQSVAQETYESRADGTFKMFVEGGPGSIRNKRERMRVLRQIYGRSWWVDPDRISSEIDDLLERGEIAQAERFFLNRIVPAEDQAFDGKAWDALAVSDHPVGRRELITIGVDGARYEDALAVVATEVATGYQWPLRIMVKPPEAGDDYEHDLDEIDGVVQSAWDEFTVWRIYIDPGSQYANIAPLLERWQGRWTDKVVKEWLMSRPKQAAMMVRKYAAAIASGDLSHDGDPVMAEHVRNARKKPVGAYDEDGHRLWTISKESPTSRKKIDGAAAGALSWEARGDAIADGATKRRKSAYSGGRGLETV